VNRYLCAFLAVVPQIVRGQTSCEQLKSLKLADTVIFHTLIKTALRPLQDRSQRARFGSTTIAGGPSCSTLHSTPQISTNWI